MKRPVVCTLQGEELFIEGLVEPYRDRGAGTDPFPGSARRSLHPRQSTIARDFMAGYLRLPKDKASVVPLGINMQGYDRRPPAPER